MLRYGVPDTERPIQSGEFNSLALTDIRSPILSLKPITFAFDIETGIIQFVSSGVAMT